MSDFTSSSVRNTTASYIRRRGQRPGLKQWIWLVAGILAGVVAVDIALYPIVASWHWPKGPIRTTRAYTEGVAESHFVPDGFGTYGHRMTGNPPVPGAPTVMILGDSHIVQDSVNDSETVGSAVERLSRAAGHPVNVKQYGWYDTAAPTYIAEAPELLKHTRATKVVAFLNFTDISAEVFNGWYWQVRLNPDGSYRLIDERPPKVEDLNKVTIRDLAGMSRLMIAGRRRLINVLDASKAAPKSEAVAAAPDVAAIANFTVRGLKEAYGDKLLIVFTPICDARCTDKPDAKESELLRACRAESAHCVSVREEMLRELRDNRRLTRGFYNTAPGKGHLNAVGLEASGRVIWNELARSLP